jgi:hypothetical protein
MNVVRNRNNQNSGAEPRSEEEAEGRCEKAEGRCTLPAFGVPVRTLWDPRNQYLSVSHLARTSQSAGSRAHGKGDGLMDPPDMKELRRQLYELEETHRWAHHVADLNSGQVLTFLL